MELTREQYEMARACGCTFFPASEAQVARLSMQNRIFVLNGKPFMATRDGGGFYETHGTLARLIEAHKRGEPPSIGETVQEAAAADAVSEREMAGERGAGVAHEVGRRATGSVKWFNVDKGFGFIQPEDGGKDVFVHITAVQAAGLNGLNDVQKVTYEVVRDQGKEAAANLKPV
jgi:CspA family cold shock protein